MPIMPLPGSFQMPHVLRAVHADILGTVAVRVDQRAVAHQFHFYLRRHERQQAHNLGAIALDQTEGIASKVEVKPERLEELHPVLIAIHPAAKQAGQRMVKHRHPPATSHAVKMQIKRAENSRLKLHRSPHSRDLHCSVGCDRVLGHRKRSARPFLLDASFAANPRATGRLAPECPRVRVEQ
jgi:hypothetical protein